MNICEICKHVMWWYHGVWRCLNPYCTKFNTIPKETVDYHEC